jgi:hypothetical protein
MPKPCNKTAFAEVRQALILRLRSVKIGKNKGMQMNIQEVCKIRKEELKLTYQEISDTSGVPLSTVQNFFS